MSQVNLLPPEIRQRAQTRKLTLMVIGAGLVVVRSVDGGATWAENVVR